MPSGGNINYNRDNIVIRQYADCASALSMEPSLTQPAQVQYNPAGSMV